MFLVFGVSFLVYIFSAMFAHIYFTVVSRLSSVRSGHARSTVLLEILTGKDTECRLGPSYTRRMS